MLRSSTTDLFLSQITGKSYQTENQSRRNHIKPFTFPGCLPVNNLLAKFNGHVYKDNGFISPHYLIYVCMLLIVFQAIKICYKILCWPFGSIAFLAVSSVHSVSGQIQKLLYTVSASPFHPLVCLDFPSTATFVGGSFLIAIHRDRYVSSLSDPFKKHLAFK